MNSTVNSTVLVGVQPSRRIAHFENHPAMPALLKELPPRAVAALFQEIGVVDATVLMAMMPTRALLLAFDESIWKSPRPGLPETMSVGDLIDWLIAWTEIGEEFLVEKMAAMSEDYLGTMLSRIVKVESASRHAEYWEDSETLVKLCEDDRERFGPYIVQPNIENGVDKDADVVADAVRALWSFDAAKLLRIFGRLADLPNPDDSTRGCTPTANDVEFDRQSFRQGQGFVTADDARAFFTFADGLTAPEIIALDRYDPGTQRYLDVIARSSESPSATLNAIVAEDLEDDRDSDPVASSAEDAADLEAELPDTAPLRALLEDARLLERKGSLPLLQDMRGSKEPVLTAELRRLAGDDVEMFHARARELAYLANVLRWLPANDIESLSDDDAKGAAFAICNLGFELMPRTRADETKNEPGLIRLFLLGWNALSAIRGRVIGAFASALSRNGVLPAWLQGEATMGLADLRRAIENKQFEEAREATIFLSIVFDSRACRAIAALLAAVPRFSMLLEGAKNSNSNSNPTRWITTKADLQTLGRLLDSLRLKKSK